MDDLALQVGQLDHVVIGNPDGPDPGGSEVEQRRRAQPSRPEDEDPGRSEPPLSGEAHFRQQQVPGITRAGLGVVEHVGRRAGSGVHR